MSERRPLREELKHKLSRERLDDEDFFRFERLLAEQNRWYATMPFSFRVGGAVAALLLLGLAVLVYFPGNDSADLPKRLAQEIFTNHVHAHSLDFETHSIEVLRAGLDRLDFVPSTRPLRGMTASRFWAPAIARCRAPLRPRCCSARSQERVSPAIRPPTTQAGLVACRIGIGNRSRSASSCAEWRSGSGWSRASSSPRPISRPGRDGARLSDNVWRRDERAGSRAVRMPELVGTALHTGSLGS